MPRNNKPTSKPQSPKSAVRRGQPRRARQLSVRSELKTHPDARRIARAVIELAMAQAEHDATHAHTSDGSTALTSEPAREVWS